MPRSAELWLKVDNRSSIPVALTIAGSDSSAGAGIQADLKTFGAFGVYGLTALTCVVAETPGLVTRIEPVSLEMVRAQIDVLLRSFPVAAIKTGLLFSSEIVSEVARILRASTAKTGAAVPLVIDPVMVATSGDLLLRDDAIESYERDLFPFAALVTPNLGEAARLLGEPIRDLAAMREAGARLTKKYGVPVLLKGGHLAGEHAIDLLFAAGKVVEFSAPFSRGVATHGTGCTYSAGIAAGLANGLSLEDAVRGAKKFVTASIAQYLAWETSQGLPLHALNHSP
ncbi:MAG: bifunctional hydroxymethylpyrimidine kinase/phosphomethylpyrimidine kinase [Chthoniobacterales bacterium]|nr:MAG: bifunctional hydroxymethylpyrimidine kinase/phosphomethylpyrimidine kinase [Chthoniobacterales bacterium]